MGSRIIGAAQYPHREWAAESLVQHIQNVMEGMNLSGLECLFFLFSGKRKKLCKKLFV
jgi:hypothetical protein